MSISNLDETFTFPEGGGLAVIDNDVAFSGGGNYSEGYLRFAVDDAKDGDQLVLIGAEEDEALAAGAISVDANGMVYVGNGTGLIRIGMIDPVENGQDGQPLKILFSVPLPNSGFEDGAAHWNVRNEQYGDDPNEIDLDGIAVELATDTDYTGGTGESRVQPNNNVNFTGSIETSEGVGGSAALYLHSTGNITRVDADTQDGFKPDGYGSIHGPYATSDVITVEQGESLSLDFRASGTDDDYEVFGLLRRVDANGDFVSNEIGADNIVLFAQRGNDTDGWVTVTTENLPAGEYRFEFVGGTYDGTGGLLVGSNLYVDNIRLGAATPIDDDLVSAIARQVAYQNTAADAPASRTIDIEAVNEAGETSSGSIGLEVDLANNPPSFSGDASLGAIDEDAADPAGATVGSIFGTLFSDPDTAYEPADTLAGIAIAGNASAADEGVWQYSLDGETWTEVGAVSPEAALLLPVDALLRFVPVADYNGTPGALSVHAVDSTFTGSFTTDPDAPQTHDTTDTSDDGAVSHGAVDLNTTVNAVNDAPRLPDGGGDITIEIETGDGAQEGELTAVDPEGSAITFEVAGGTTTDGVSTLAGAYGTLTIDTISGEYTFTPDPDAIVRLGEDETDTDSFTVRISDGDAVTEQVIAIKVTGRNDAPAFSGNGALDAIDEDTADPAGASVQDLFGGLYEDPDDSGTLGGIAISANPSTAGEGTWQFQLAGETEWQDVGEVSPTHMLLLPTDALLRFVPAADYNGTPGPLSVHAVDDEIGAARLTDADAMRYWDTATDGAVGGTSPIAETAVELGTSVNQVDDLPEGSISLSGVVAAGQTLTARPTEITDADGIDDGAISFQWQRLDADTGEWVDIAGAIGPAYQLTDDDVGHPVRYVATYVDQDGNPGLVPSAATAPVAESADTGDAPVLARVTVNGERVTLRFEDEDSLNAASQPAAGQFVVTVNGREVPVTEVAVNGDARTVTLTLETAVRPGQNVSLSYVPQGDAGFAPIEDVAGNDAAELLDVAVDNLTRDPEPELPIGVVRDGTTTTTTDSDGTVVTRTEGTLGNGRVVETVTETPDGRSQHELTYTPGASSGAVSLPLLYENIVGSPNYTMLTLPRGVALGSLGLRTPHADDAADADLIELISGTVGSEDGMRGAMIDGGRAFLAELGADATVWEHKIVLEAVEGSGVPVDPIVIDAAADRASGRFVEGLVIDATGLHAGTVIELEDVDFAVVLGEGIVVRGGAGENTVFGGAGSQDIVLSGANDVIYGGEGDDVVGSTGSDARLFGNAGEDRMLAGSGENLLHGGSESDVAEYAGNIAQYEIVREHGITWVRSLETPDDVSMLVNVETIRFADATYTVENDAPLTWIASLYEKVLDRQAELTGFQYWAASHEAGMSIGEIAMSMLYSVEYAGNEGSEFQALPAADQIELLYEHFLGRDSEPQGHAYWTSLLEEGVNITEIAQSFVMSAEMQGTLLAPEGWDFYL